MSKYFLLVFALLVIPKLNATQEEDFFEKNPTIIEVKRFLSGYLTEESCECPLLPDLLGSALKRLSARYSGNKWYEECNALAQQLRNSSNDFCSQAILLGFYRRRLTG